LRGACGATDEAEYRQQKNLFVRPRVRLT
jgi:hypothetical protein